MFLNQFIAAVNKEPWKLVGPIFLWQERAAEIVRVRNSDGYVLRRIVPCQSGDGACVIRFIDISASVYPDLHSAVHGRDQWLLDLPEHDQDYQYPREYDK